MSTAQTTRKTYNEEDICCRALLAAIRAFMRERGDMPAQYIQTFLLVATEPGLGVSEYALRAGVSKSVMSRHILDLGVRHRSGEPGLGLLYTKQNPMNLRAHEVFLTDKGVHMKSILNNAYRMVEPSKH